MKKLQEENSVLRNMACEQTLPKYLILNKIENIVVGVSIENSMSDMIKTFQVPLSTQYSLSDFIPEILLFLDYFKTQPLLLS